MLLTCCFPITGNCLKSSENFGLLPIENSGERGVTGERRLLTEPCDGVSSNYLPPEQRVVAPS